MFKVNNKDTRTTTMAKVMVKCYKSRRSKLAMLKTIYAFILSVAKTNTYQHKT